MRTIHDVKEPQPAAWPWPLPALLAWTFAWGAWTSAVAFGASPAWALAAGCAAGALLAFRCGGLRRRLIAVGGFPVSTLLLGLGADVPVWLWPTLALPMLAVYPLRAWRDAPFFPTPARALDGLAPLVGEPARVLDAGCGAGHGLTALRRLWPQAELQGVEWSWPLARLAAWRCRDARVVQGDMWTFDWSGHDLVYLFQRPESMARAWTKACKELSPQAWLVSLEFEVPGQAAFAQLQHPGRRPVWVYRPGQPKQASMGGCAGR